MNKVKKNISVRFYSIDTNSNFFKQFAANYSVSYDGSSNSRIITIRNAKYLIKAINGEEENFFILVVKERNTWQAKTTRDGSISGLNINQGIIGDPYYFYVLPNKKLILGFTTGPSGSLKSVAKVVLDQFNSNRTSKITLSLIPKEKEFSKLLELPDYSSLHFKINSSSLIDLTDDAPQLIKNLGSAPYIENNIQLSLDLECSEAPDSIVTKQSLIEIVTYLSESDSCTLLKVKGLDKYGKQVSLDFSNAFLSHKAEVLTRNNYIDESAALTILNSSLDLTANIN